MDRRKCSLHAAFLVLAVFTGTGASQDAQPPGQLSDSFTVRYLDLAIDRIIPCSPKDILKEGRRLDIQGFEGSMLSEILGEAKPRAFFDPYDVRMAILQPGKETIFFGTDGEITQGKKSWQLRPRSFLELYIEMEHIERQADKKSGNPAKPNTSSLHAFSMPQDPTRVRFPAIRGSRS